MASMTHNTLRRAILGLMVLLAGVSTCYCESYDADPNDNIPPVTFELNYLVPASAHHAQIAVHNDGGLATARLDVAQQFMTTVAVVHPEAVPLEAILNAPLLVPLRT